MQTVDRFDSKGWFIWDQVIFWCVLCVCWQNSMQHLSKKTISEFSVSPGSVETLVGWGGKIKQLFIIAYYLGNISDKNYQNPFVYVIVIVYNISVVFLRHSVCHLDRFRAKISHVCGAHGREQHTQIYRQTYTTLRLDNWYDSTDTAV